MRLRPIHFALALTAGAAMLPTMLPASPPPPQPLQATVTAPPSGAATAFPEGTVVSYTGRLLDLQQGFVFFSSGDGFKLGPNARIVDAATGNATTLKPGPRVFARATFDKASKTIVLLGLSQRPLTGGIALEEVKQYAQVLSPVQPNPDLAPKPGTIPGRQGTGRQIPVTITIQVPPTTPLGADIYLSTDVSSYNPRAIRAERIDVNHFRLRTTFAVGTVINYKITRGDWNTAERGPTNLETDPHVLDLRTQSDVVNNDITIEHWADDAYGSGNAPGPQGIPTPYNPGALPFPVNGGPSRTPPPGTPRKP